jgi:large subunit ribosomal protein L35
MKQKTHKGASKRFKISKTGKLLHRSHSLRHLRSVKGKKRIRSLKVMKRVTGTFEKKIKKLLAVR